jgi:hypothetical protein
MARTFAREGFVRALITGWEPDALVDLDLAGMPPMTAEEVWDWTGWHSDDLAENKVPLSRETIERLYDEIASRGLDFDDRIFPATKTG